MNGNLPIQKAAKHGNDHALEWIIKKWKEHSFDLEINKLNNEGYTSLMNTCERGYSAGSAESAARLQMTKHDRFKCCSILIREGADVNIQNEFVKMTALHWAAYNDDARTTQLLIKSGAKSLFNIDKNTPVDIAAICENWTIVRILCEDFNERTAIMKNSPMLAKSIEKSTSIIAATTSKFHDNRKVIPIEY